MRIFVGSLMIFFGTLLVAGLLALGQPGGLGIDESQVRHQVEGLAHQEPPRWWTLVALLGSR